MWICLKIKRICVQERKESSQTRLMKPVRKNTPFLSVIIPTLNEEKYLPFLLLSLAQQSFQDFEVIVVDGNSDDQTVKVAKSFEKKVSNLHILESKKRSLPYQRNMGASKATGDWLLFIDADTVCLPYMTERVKAFTALTKSHFFTSWCRSDTDTCGDAKTALVANYVLEYGFGMKQPLAPGPFTVVKRTVFDWVGGYDDTATFGEDYDLTLRLLKRGISYDIIRETLFIWSMRRIRTHGAFQMIRQYFTGAVYMFFFKKALKKMPGYTMGGHAYMSK